MTLLVAAASVALVATALTRRPVRIQGLKRSASARRGPAPIGWSASVLRRFLPFDTAVGDLTLLAFTTTALGLLVVSPVLALLPVAVLVVVSSHHRRSAAAETGVATDRVLPEVIDLIILGVGSGLTSRHSLEMSLPWLQAPFSSAVSEVIRRSNGGEAFAVALEMATTELGPAARPLINTLIASETDGAALLPALLRVSDEARRRRRVEAENRARRVPVSMLFPLVLCILPAFALLTVVPLLIGTLTDLELPG